MRQRFFHVALLMALLPACDRCGSSSSSSSGSSSSSTAAASSSATKLGYLVTLKGHGVAGKFFKAVVALALNDEQKDALDKIGAELEKAEASASKAPDGGVDAELKSIHAELIAGVKANKVDLAKIDALSATHQAATKAQVDREYAALNQIQRLLTKEQRSSVAATIRAGESRHAARIRSRTHRDAGASDGGASGGSFAGVRRVDAGGAKAAMNAPINWTRLRLESYTKDLGLEPEQAKKVEALLDKASAAPATDAREDRAVAIEALVAAFEKEGFDANRHPIPEVQDRRAALMTLVKYIAEVVPILKPEQNQKLATRLVEPEAHKPHHAPDAHNIKHSTEDDEDL